MNEVLTTTSLISLACTALAALASFGLAHAFGKKISKLDRWVLTWLWWDTMIHFILEGAFVMISLNGSVKDSKHMLASTWKEYGKADQRWLVSDPNIVALEMLTVFLDGPLCLLLIYAICHNKQYRHFVQIVLCVCELYGGWMTFCPDWLIGSPNLATDHFLFLWVYLVFFNGIWVVVPCALLYQSWRACQDAFSPVSDTSRTSTTYNLRSRKANKTS